MKIRRFEAASMPAALRQVKAKLGPDAVLLDTQMGGAGVIVTAAVDDDAVHAAPAEQTLVGEVRQLLDAVRTLVAGSAPATAPEAAALARALAAHGVDPAIATALVAATAGRLAHGARDVPAAVAGALPPAAPAGARVRLVFGPAGDGKTTTLVKLAARERAAGRSVALVAADGFRVGGAAELEAYGRVLGVPVLRAAEPGALRRTLATTAAAADAVLVDTPGAGPGQKDELAELARLAEEAGPDAARLLVVSAASGAAAAGAAWSALAPLAPSTAVLAKSDAASGTPWLALLWRHRVPVGWLATGRRIPDDLEPATADRLARRLLTA
jgi:flagellar biosynthesis protein FlhF